MPSGAQGDSRRPPPGFAYMVNLTTDEEDMDKAPATPPANISDSDGDMKTGDEDDLLVYTGEGRDGAASSSDDGFEHI